MRLQLLKDLAAMASWPLPPQGCYNRLTSRRTGARLHRADCAGVMMAEWVRRGPY